MNPIHLTVFLTGVLFFYWKYARLTHAVKSDIKRAIAVVSQMLLGIAAAVSGIMLLIEWCSK